ncbi:MAG: beta-galactosidase [Dorea sp.]|nr:beta-galactosidase [Dorea sp.]
MKADIRWLDTPEVFRVGQMDAHSDHSYYAGETEYKKGKSSFVQSLNGVWKFCYSENAMERPADFYKEGYDYSGYDEILVPQHIEIAGYDKIHYINTMYPWEGKMFRRPPFSGMKGAIDGMFSKASYNPVGSYVRTFDLEQSLRGKRISVCFEGVEQAVYVWLNGEFVGYAEDTFTPSEFDLTSYVKDEGNVLAVEVHKRSTAAFIEDQDFFRFFGIFRDVKLYARPDIHLDDLWLRPEYNVEDETGKLNLRMIFSDGCDGRLCRDGRVKITVVDGEELLICETREIEEDGCRQCCFDMPGKVKKWDNKNPYLYQLFIEVQDKEGSIIELVPYRFGFRRIEIKDKVMYLNGQRLIINGVNRHEWNANSGRCITAEDETWDMECIKRNHINAVRTCHYPDRIPWYYLCDENGIYMMSETNLESHGSFMTMNAVEGSWNVPGDFKEWEACVLDRAKTHFEVFKNHTAILFWSLGNESYAGEALVKMNRYFKEQDPDRLTHYEGVFHRPALKEYISDMESHMYSPPEKVVEYLENNPPKPFILCEYMHDMGNSLGGFKSYIELLDKYEQYQGGFIWDYIDQAVFVEDEVTGRKVLRYGGDFDDRPSDYEFAGNGIVFADRTEKPAMQEVRYYYGLYR